MWPQKSFLTTGKSIPHWGKVRNTRFSQNPLTSHFLNHCGMNVLTKDSSIPLSPPSVCFVRLVLPPCHISQEADPFPKRSFPRRLGWEQWLQELFEVAYSEWDRWFWVTILLTLATIGRAPALEIMLWKNIFIMVKEATHFLCQVLLIAKNITAAIFQYLCVIKIFFPLHWDGLKLNDGL